MQSAIQAERAGKISIGESIKVNRLGLGTNRITDTEQSRELLLRAVELGVNFIDTADIYTKTESEKMIAKTLSPYTSGLVIATKGAMSHDDHHTINDPDYLRSAIDASLVRLCLKTIDLYQIHRLDPSVPIKQTMGVMKEAIEQGKIRNVGLSEVSVEQIEEARKVVPIATVQNHYNIMTREHESVVDYCDKEGIAFLPFFPLGHGRIDLDQPQILAMAKKYGSTKAQIALTWLLKRSPLMLPIPGTLSIKHLEENLAAGAIELSDEDFERLSM